MITNCDCNVAKLNLKSQQKLPAIYIKNTVAPMKLHCDSRNTS